MSENRLGPRDQPLSPAAQGQPRPLVGLGARGAGRGQAHRQADPALGRLRRLPLVPRHGARELRGRGHRRRHERALRQHQGRPRGAPRHRRHLHARAARAGRAGRLAADHVPRQRGAAVLGRHLLPARRRAIGRPGFSQVLREVARVYREERRQGRPQRRPAGRRPERARRRQPHGHARDRATACSPTSRARMVSAVDPRHGGLSGAPKFPQWSFFWLLWRGAIRYGNAGAPGTPSTPRSPTSARAASTITSAAASRATRSTSAGSCRTSRRCSTTTPC